MEKFILRNKSITSLEIKYKISIVFGYWLCYIRSIIKKGKRRTQNIKQVIETSLIELSNKVKNNACKHDLDTLKFVTYSEFKQTSFIHNNLNYLHFINNLKVDQVINYLNCYEGMKVN